MLNYIIKKLAKRKIRKTFKEYGFVNKRFDLAHAGALDYAQWLHPFEKPVTITQDQVDFYKQFLEKGGVAIDIGAHTGDTSVPMAFAAGKEGVVLAIEPNKYVFKILKENSKLNLAKSNIIPLNFAVTAQDGTFTFNYSDASFCNGGFLSKINKARHNHNYSLEVNGKNLEKYLDDHYKELLPRLSFIKIDAEGYDKEIIKSIRSIILAFKPYIITECYKQLTKEERSDLFNTIKDLGYHLYYIEDLSTNNRIQIKHEYDMLKWKHFDMVLIPQEKLAC